MFHVNKVFPDIAYYDSVTRIMYVQDTDVTCTDICFIFSIILGFFFNLDFETWTSSSNSSFSLY